jgi:hypothetical protein
MKKKSLLILTGLVSLVILSGCFTSQKIKAVTGYSSLIPIESSATNQIDIKFESNDLFPIENNQAIVTKNKDYVIVLPFVTWHKRNYDCEVGSSFFETNLLQNISSSINSAVDSLYGNQLSSSYDLFLDVNDLSYRFNYFAKGGMAGFPPILSFTWKTELCLETALSLGLDYKLIKDGTSVTSGSIANETIIDTIDQYTPVPAFKGGELNSSPEWDNLNGGIYPLIMKQVALSSIKFNELIDFLAIDLVDNHLKEHLE